MLLPLYINCWKIFNKQIIIIVSFCFFIIESYISILGEDITKINTFFCVIVIPFCPLNMQLSYYFLFKYCIIIVVHDIPKYEYHYENN